MNVSINPQLCETSLANTPPLLSTQAYLQLAISATQLKLILAGKQSFAAENILCLNAHSRQLLRQILLANLYTD